MICPKCLTVESEGSLDCRKCGAQLHTGVFRMPVVEPPEPRDSSPPRPGSLRARLIVVMVLALAAVLMVLILGRLDSIGR